MLKSKIYILGRKRAEIKKLVEIKQEQTFFKNLWN